MAAVLPLALSGCMLPRSGPSASEFARSADAGAIRLVEATAQDAAESQKADPGIGFTPEWQAVQPINTDVIGVGDTLDVTIFERDGLGMFPAAQDGASHLAGLPVETTGSVQLPYIGSVAVAGLTPAEARQHAFAPPSPRGAERGLDRRDLGPPQPARLGAGRCHQAGHGSPRA